MRLRAHTERQVVRGASRSCFKSLKVISFGLVRFQNRRQVWQQTFEIKDLGFLAPNQVCRRRTARFLLRRCRDPWRARRNRSGARELNLVLQAHRCKTFGSFPSLERRDERLDARLLRRHRRSEASVGEVERLGARSHAKAEPARFGLGRIRRGSETLERGRGWSERSSTSRRRRGMQDGLGLSGE